MTASVIARNLVLGVKTLAGSGHRRIVTLSAISRSMIRDWDQCYI